MSHRRALLLVLVLIGGAAQAVIAGDGSNPVPVDIEPQVYTSFATAHATWDVWDADGEVVDTAEWRIVTGTGNCCENFVMAGADGRLFNWGGTYIIYSDDEGQSWHEVRPPTSSPVDNGEGAIATAPDGDIVGITWDPYQGDRLMAFRHDAQTEVWSYAEQPLHAPFYDREWVTTIPGLDLGQGGDYVTAIRGAYPSKDVIQYSGDALIYTLAGSKRAEAAVTAPLSHSLPVAAHPEADWTQSHAETTIVPLGDGYAFGGREFIGAGIGRCTTQRYLLTPDGLWHCYGGGVDVQWQAADSEATLHAAEWNPNGTLTHITSIDGGETVTRTPLTVPAGLEIGGDIDMRINASLGVGVIAASARDASSVGQHMAFVIEQDPETNEWVHDRTMLVGDGDLDYSSGVGASIRFDFASVALLPDGRVALSFNDASHTTPALAIEMADEVLEPSGSAVEPSGVPVSELLAPPNLHD